MTIQHEHEFEAVPGLPEALPAGEKILWQGAPRWTAFARHVFYARALTIYFGLILLWRLVTLLDDPEPVQGGTHAVLVFAVLAGLAVLAIAIVCAIAWLASRTTLYTITNRRVVMRIGVVLCITFNLPFSVIENVGLRRYRDGTGDLPLRLKAPNKIAIFHLWPHARPWRLAQPEPMLRTVPDAALAGRILTEAMQAWANNAAQPSVVATGDAPIAEGIRPRPPVVRPLAAAHS